MLLLGLLVATASGVSAPPVGPPPAGTWGFHITFFGDPFPSLTGAGAHYYVADFLRLEGHAGYLGVGLSAKLTIPELDLTPVVGFSGAYTRVAGIWDAGFYATAGVQLYGRGHRSLEAGVHCGPGVLDGDFSECLPYLRFGSPFF